MLLRNTIQKTKIFFQKTFQNLKSFLFGEYQKLHKNPPLNISSFNNRNSEMQKLDQFYRDFSERWPSDHNKSMRKKTIKSVMSVQKPMNLMKEEDYFTRSSMRFEEHRIQTINNEERGKEEKKMGSSHEEKRRNQCSESVNEGGYVLAKKMKELEMMNVNDVDHVLDIEEVLHYYSRLTCPVYLDIVDKFFMDMYSEFFLPQPSVGVHNSMRRLSPVKF